MRSGKRRLTRVPRLEDASGCESLIPNPESRAAWTYCLLSSRSALSRPWASRETVLSG